MQCGKSHIFCREYGIKSVTSIKQYTCLSLQMYLIIGVHDVKKKYKVQLTGKTC